MPAPAAVADAAWSAAVDVLGTASDVVLVGHVAPDGDAVGSVLGLGLALRRRGVRVRATFGDAVGSAPPPVARPWQDLPGLDLLVGPDALPAAPAVVVSLDAASPERLGALLPHFTAAACRVVVDHHASNTDGTFGDVRVVDPSAASTTVLVAELVDRLGVPLDAELAAPLYAGLLTDTGSFRHAATDARAHTLAARLVRTGLRHDRIAEAVWGRVPFAAVRVLGLALSRARLEPDALGGAGLVWTSVSQADLRAAGADADAAERVVDALRVADRADVAVVVKEQADGTWSVSTRSRGSVDVGSACGALGGGGHRLAAGFETAGPAAPEAVVARFVAAVPTPAGR